MKQAIVFNLPVQVEKASRRTYLPLQWCSLLSHLNVENFTVSYRQPLTLTTKGEYYVPEHKVEFIHWYEDWDGAGEPATADAGTPSIRPLSNTSDNEDLDSSNEEEQLV
jgi:hypothetical protein